MISPKRFIASLIVVITIGLLLVGCGSEESTPKPTATISPTEGKLSGVLVDKSTQKPVRSINLQLLQSDESKGWGVTMICDTTASSGVFSFENITPGKYGIEIVSQCNEINPIPKMITDNSGSAIIFEVEAGKLLDVGNITITQ